MKSISCAQCGAVLKPYFLKGGVCRACHNPELVVTSLSVIDQLITESKELIRCRGQYKATEDETEKRLALDIYITQWKAFERAVKAVQS